EMDRISDELYGADHHRADDEGLCDDRVTSLSGRERDETGNGCIAQKYEKAENPIEQRPLGHAWARPGDDKPDRQDAGEAADTPQHRFGKQLEKSIATGKNRGKEDRRHRQRIGRIDGDVAVATRNAQLEEDQAGGENAEDDEEE